MNTINLNGTDIPKVTFLLVTAKSVLRILSIGLKVRNVNLKTIKQSLASEGVILKGKNAKECLNEVIQILNNNQ